MAGEKPAPADESPPDAAARRRREVRRAALGLAALVGAVFLAWLGGEVVRAWLKATRRRPAALFGRHPGPATLPASRPASLADLIANPLAGTGLQPAEGDPAGVRPPRGARRLYGFVRRLSDQVEQQAHYEVPAAAGEVIAHYDAVLAARGLRKLREAPGPSGGRTAVYGGQGAWATVALRKAPSRPKMVIVVVTVVSAAPARGSR